VEQSLWTLLPLQITELATIGDTQTHTHHDCIGSKMETRVTGRPFEFEAEVKTDMQGGWAFIEDERPYETDEAPLVARWTVPQTNGLVFGGTASRVETDDDAFECEGRDKGEGTGGEPDDNNKAADTQGRVALIEDKRPFKADEAVVEALRTVLQINILAVGGTARGEADDDKALDGNIDNGQSGNDEAGEDVANEEKAVDNEAADECHLVSTLSGAGGLESAALSAKCMNLGCQEGGQWKILGSGKFSEQQGGKQFELNAGSSVGEDDAGESS